MGEEGKMMNLNLCYCLGEAGYRQIARRSREKCSGMIQMGIILQRFWNISQVTIAIRMMRIQILAVVTLCRPYSLPTFIANLCSLDKQRVNLLQTPILAELEKHVNLQPLRGTNFLLVGMAHKTQTQYLEFLLP